MGNKSQQMPKIKLSALGEKMYNTLTYSFSIMNIGGETKNGFSVSLAGEAVDEGGLRAKELVIQRMNALKETVPFEKVIKKDGRIAYIAKAAEQTLKSCKETEAKRGTEQYFIESMQKQITLRFECIYDDTKDREVLLTVFPHDDILTGADSVWKIAAPALD
jgi:hypothetical protein